MSKDQRDIDPETGDRRRATGHGQFTTDSETGDRQRATGHGQFTADSETGDRQQVGDGRTAEMRRGANIASRLLDLATEVLGIAKTLQKDTVGRHVLSQVIRSVTSAGANYEEARAAESRADFIHKLGIAMKEMRETQYWLRLIARSALTSHTATSAINESIELAAILGASRRTARANDH